MNKMKVTAVLLACLMLATVLFAGCSDLPASSDAGDRVAEEPSETPEPTEEPTPEPTEEPSEEPTETFLYNAYGSGDSQVLFTNSTDYVFRSLELQGPTETEFGSNLIADNGSIQQGETFALNYTPASAAEVTPDPEEEILFSDNVYNVRLTTDAGEEYVLYDSNLADMDTAIIRWDEEGDVLYLEFKSVSTGDIINTLEAQLFMKDYAAGAIDETPAQEAQAISSGSSHSESSGSGSSGSGSGSSGSSGSAAGSSGSSGSDSSGGDSSGSSSEGSSGSSGDSSGGSSDSDDWSGGDAGAGDCLEDNIIWND